MIKTRDDLQDYLDKDKRALGMKKRRPSIIGDEVWKFEIALRMDEFYRNTQKNKLAGLFWKWRHRQLGLKLGFSIPCNCFGGGLKINHYGLIVVHPLARIGEWCDIHQGVNIGQNIEKGSVPVIGDNVWIGANVTILPGITIGDYVVVAAGSVVTKDVPSGVLVAGVPAIVKKRLI